MTSVTPNGSVQRLEFGSRIAAREGGLQGVNAPTSGAGVRRQVRTAAAELRKHDVELERGPYADVNGAVAGLVSDIGAQAPGAGKAGLLKCTGDALTPGGGIGGRRFIYDEGAVLGADEPVSAGAILEGAARLCMDEKVPDSPFTIFNNPMEPYILAASVLRRLDLDAYPALAPGSCEGTAYFPLLAVLAPEDDVPLHLLSITPHGRFTLDSLLLIGDSAMNGVGQAMQARNKASHLALEVVESVLERTRDGDIHPLPSVTPRIAEISSLLAGCRDAWPGSPFLEDSLAFLGMQLASAFNFAGAEAMKRSSMDELPLPLSPQDALAAVQCVAVAAAQTYVKAVRKRLGI